VLRRWRAVSGLCRQTQERIDAMECVNLKERFGEQYKILYEKDLNDKRLG